MQEVWEMEVVGFTVQRNKLYVDLCLKKNTKQTP